MATILVVDDNKPYREDIVELLELEGYTALAAENGVDALLLLQQQKFDLVLSNGDMPKMSGIELLKAVRADEQLKTIPFVLMTGHTESGYMENIYQAGADAFLLKPIEVETLYATLRKLLGA